MTQPAEGRLFWKMSGSGNDFIFFDARELPPGALADAQVVRALCRRGTGVGADGVVFLERSTAGSYGIRYLNSDGSVGALCGNASLCSISLAAELGIAGTEEGAAASGTAEGLELAIETEAGVLTGRMRDGLPEIDLQPIAVVRPAASVAAAAGSDLPDAAGAREMRVGFALAGVPHLVVLCKYVESVDLPARGAALRHDPSLPEGANVNFVSRRASGGWMIRTYERGVEGETLACGTGAVASAILLTAWGEAGGEVELHTRSGRVLSVRVARSGELWYPSLRGEGRLVYRGVLGEYS